MEATKMNFFEQIIYAVSKPMKYYKLSKVSGGRLTGFVFLFMFIVTFFSTVIPIIDAFTGSDSVFRVIDRDLPYFEMKNGQLSVDERYELNEAGTYILVDTNVDRFTSADVDQSYSQVILVSRTNYIQYSMGRTQEYDFKYLNGFDFNKDLIQVFKPFVYLIMILVVIFMYLFGVGAYFLTALLYSLIGLFVSYVSNVHLPYAKIFKVAIYSKVTIKIVYTLIGLVNAPIPGTIKNLIAIAVTCIYVVYGILSHKSDEANLDGRSNPQNNYYNNYNNNNFPQ